MFRVIFRLLLCLLPSGVALVHEDLRAEQVGQTIQLTPSLQVTYGAINQVTIHKDGEVFAVYGSDDANTSQILLTHHRRDVVAAVKEAPANCELVAPEAERALIEKPQEFWGQFVTTRFHDYAQQSTKVLASPLPVSRWVKSGDVVSWKGIEFQVHETPGYTRGSVSYFAVVDDVRVAFTGDLIYGDGQILDLYSFQDEIAEAKIRGYHGYGGRLASLISSLEQIAKLRPDVLVSSRGPVIRDPAASIGKLIDRVRRLYKNYLSTNALHWYFQEDRMRLCGERILGKGAEVELMPFSLHKETPDWVFEQATSRLLISDDGHGFLLDCGYQRVIDAVNRLIEMGLVEKIDGIFVTHYHDDHTDMVQAAADEFQCPVYATEQYVDVLKHPANYHLPAMTSNAITDIRSMRDGEKMKWQEFEFTFHFFPGQTFYHGGLFVKRNEERPIFFVGDAFAPSGIDDYCVLNRNLVHADTGYNLCFQKMRDIDEKYWIVNEHIPFVFSFSDSEMDYLQTRYDQRVEILRSLFPWDDPNYGIDEQWAVFYPYGVTAKPTETVALEVRVTNHSPQSRTFQLVPHVADEMKVLSSDTQITVKARATGTAHIQVRVPAKPGNYLVTADISSDGMEFREWVESLIVIQ